MWALHRLRQRRMNVGSAQTKAAQKTSSENSVISDIKILSHYDAIV
jgi:hypothetical protein